MSSDTPDTSPTVCGALGPGPRETDRLAEALAYLVLELLDCAHCATTPQGRTYSEQCASVDELRGRLVRAAASLESLRATLTPAPLYTSRLY